MASVIHGRTDRPERGGACFWFREPFGRPFFFRILAQPPVLMQ